MFYTDGYSRVKACQNRKNQAGFTWRCSSNNGMLFVVLSILPGKIYNIMNGSNAAAVDRSGFEQTELYGLKIAQLLCH